MKIIKTKSVPESARTCEYHIVTFAETVFATINIYGDDFGIERDVIENFSKQANLTDESGSLHPKAQISCCSLALY